MAVKRYSVNYNGVAECLFDIDHSILTEDYIHGISRFWKYHEERVDGKGSALNGVLRLLTKSILEIQFECNLSIENLKVRLALLEGCPPLDGSYGITLIKADTFSFDESYMSIIVHNLRER